MELKLLSKGEGVVNAKATFNRTLWNWNEDARQTAFTASELLIEPYGIETPGSGQGANRGQRF